MNRVLIFAGGTGKRMGSSSIPKQFLIVSSKPILVHTIEKFQKCDKIDSIVLVCLKDYIEKAKELIKEYNLNKVVSVVEGGNSGQESIFFGLKELVRLYGDNNDDVVLIHDGVRPLIYEQTILDNLECVKKNKNAITTCKAIETVVVLNDDGLVNQVVDRAYCNLARAPQSFYLKDIYSAHIKANNENKHDFIDSAMLMQYYGAKLHTVEGPVENIKITTPMDFYLFKAILAEKENEQLKLL